LEGLTHAPIQAGIGERIVMPNQSAIGDSDAYQIPGQYTLGQFLQRRYGLPMYRPITQPSTEFSIIPFEKRFDGFRGPRHCLGPSVGWRTRRCETSKLSEYLYHLNRSPDIAPIELNRPG